MLLYDIDGGGYPFKDEGSVISNASFLFAALWSSSIMIKSNNKIFWRQEVFEGD